ncbi:hypothetical protein [Amycolatopsis magusensis]|uniref:hypothetical protein n=1 Tax=Amycolatopsis magusensis TaxID=882444 RepID=UPI003C304F9D
MAISQSWIDKYSAGPSDYKVSKVKALHEIIRKVLASANEGPFDTFLQGSYKNDTAISDINDVDIVALYDPWASPANHRAWQWLFEYVAQTLSDDSRIPGSISIGDKCVKLEGAVNADIVPAISRTSHSSSDPISIYSLSERGEVDNHPRTHYDNGVSKQKQCNGTYKATVRLFKHWSRQYPYLNAPSFYIECLISNLPASSFDAYLPLAFARIAAEIFGLGPNDKIWSVARDKDILVSSEWPYDDFAEFQVKLRADFNLVMSALESDSSGGANRLWRTAFGDFD